MASLGLLSDTGQSCDFLPSPPAPDDQRFLDLFTLLLLHSESLGVRLSCHWPVLDAHVGPAGRRCPVNVCAEEEGPQSWLPAPPQKGSSGSACALGELAVAWWEGGGQECKTPASKCPTMPPTP